jgi:hypothetical protein
MLAGNEKVQEQRLGRQRVAEIYAASGIFFLRAKVLRVGIGNCCNSVFLFFPNIGSCWRR